MPPIIPCDIQDTAARCRHYAMCKIDYLGTGLCPPAEEMPYVSYFPQGRMDICHALGKNLIPVTETLADIIDSCSLCGRCDRQCHFITGLRPMEVMKSMKSFLARYRDNSGTISHVPADGMLNSLREIVGIKWAANDPAILISYSNDPFPLAERQMPQYVVLPGNAEELVEVVKLCNRTEVPFVVRGNGGSVFGFVFTDGIVIDANRMKKIRIDPENWIAEVEPGVTSFELQKAAAEEGFRVNTAEPAATVCGNIVCTGMFSTWANAYGVGADHFVEVTFADEKGNVFRSSDKDAPNVFGFENAVVPSPGICIQAKVRLYPVNDDETGLLVPFSSFSDAVDFSRNLSQRRIGLAVGILGGHYLSSFISPTADLANKARRSFTDVLEIEYAVCVVGDQYSVRSIKQMVPCVMDQRHFKMLVLGLPRLAETEWEDLVEGFEGNTPAYEAVFSEEMFPVLEAMLSPSPEALAGEIDADLRDFYRDLYGRPQMTNLVWLNTFRILSARMSRHKHMFAFLVYVPLDRKEVIKKVIDGLKQIAQDEEIEHDFGFLTPIDFGKRAILEYDYFIDHTDRKESEKIQRAMKYAAPLLDELSAEYKGIKWLKYVFSQGCARKESFLYA